MDFLQLFGGAAGIAYYIFEGVRFILTFLMPFLIFLGYRHTKKCSKELTGIHQTLKRDLKEIKNLLRVKISRKQK